MNLDLATLQKAYQKLKSYIYYDNTDLILRRHLVEFESNSTKDIPGFLNVYPEPYQLSNVEEHSVGNVVETKLQYFLAQLSNYHNDSAFFDSFISKINVDCYPKKIAPPDAEENFVSNVRQLKEYKVERVNAFINAPIEIHLISVLWILLRGATMDKALKPISYGNRLLLNKDRTKIVEGSGLFIPYFKQYQKWRDASVEAAERELARGNDVLFINLDIKDFFHSVRLKSKKLYDKKKKHHDQSVSNIENIFLQVHERYTLLVGKDLAIPRKFYSSIKRQNGRPAHVVLPIGLLSSYVLANDYLKNFDEKVIKELKPAYYGRYVDDLLFVIKNPIVDNLVNNKESKLISCIEANLRSLFKITKVIHTRDKKNRAALELFTHPGLHCQSDKSFAYYFDPKESSIVLDKLKKELDDRTSEFRDLPEEDNDEEFEEAAYYLNYDGTDGKIRTLKDYKENRYGLTVFLANKIFSALRHDKRLSKQELDQVILFFRGHNCLAFFRLWERIFTFFIVHKEAKAFVDFYLHCFEQIERISEVIEGNQIQDKLRLSLLEYLDSANELALALNPKFLVSNPNAAKNLEAKLSMLQTNSLTLLFNRFDPTKSDSWWLRRFRETNLIRHHYVVQPLLNYTKAAKEKEINLLERNVHFELYDLDEELVANSPRRVKFWECTLATAFSTIWRSNLQDGVSLCNVLGLTFIPSEGKDAGSSWEFYLDNAFELFKRINRWHIPGSEFAGSHSRDHFYQTYRQELQVDHFNKVYFQEIHVGKNSPHLARPKVAFANTAVELENIRSALQDNPNLTLERYQTLATIMKKIRRERADMILFPECFCPSTYLSTIARYSEKNEKLMVTGVEHVIYSKRAFNFIVTILPVTVAGVKDAIVVFRLKNHYAPSEEELIDGYHLTAPKPNVYRYDLFNFRNIYFANYYCFELADAFHRSLLKSKVDLLIGVEWNRDTLYFGNIVEAGSRDLHCYVAQVNTCQFGDTRLTQPSDSASKDILRLKGGRNDAILVDTIDIEKLRQFQLMKHSLSKEMKHFKPLPPDFRVEDVRRRQKNLPVFNGSTKN